MLEVAAPSTGRASAGALVAAEASPDANAGPLSPVTAAANGFVRYVDARAARVPLPGRGRTVERFEELSAVAREDLCAARLVEGHLDAAAVLAELRAEPIRPGQYWAVWAAEPPGAGLTATRTADGWLLDGLKRYCSGAHTCTDALVSARAEDGRRLFAVRTRPADSALPSDGGPRDGPGCRPVPGTWPAVGMAGSDSPDVRFTAVPATEVGGVGAYVDRPGFHHGGVGVAACWYGGAQAVARVLYARAERRGDPFTDQHTGAVDLGLYSAQTVLLRAAEEIDDDPADRAGTAGLRALRVRSLVARVCGDVLDHVGRATGAEPLCHDARHARMAADLAVYVRQHHAERDLAALGAQVSRPDGADR